MLTGLLSVATALELIVFAVDVAVGSPMPWISPLLIGILLLPTYGLMWLTRSTAPPTNLLVGGLATVTLLVVLGQGGLGSPVVVVWIALPIVAMLLGDRRSGIVWTAILVATFTTLVVIGPLPRSLPSSATEGFMPMMVTLVICAALTFLADRGRDRAEATMEQARAQAEAATASRTEFLAMMSHEVRTPLYGILASAELLGDRKLDPTSREYVDTIRKSGHGLLALLGDILDLTKLEADKLALESVPVDLGDLVDTVAAAVRPLADPKVAIETDVHGARLVMGDETRLRQILLNLAVNATRFTEIGSITIRASSQDGTTLLEVEDTGVGMTPEQQVRLLRPFEQADASTSRRHGGTGLGLSIASQLAQAMDGQLSIRSEVGRGSSFGVRLPLPVASVTRLPTGPTPSQNDENRRQLRVLAAEDHPVNRRLLTAMLSSIGVGQLRVAEDGDDVIERFVQDPSVDVILMDLEMPGTDGIEATRRIRALEGGDSPIIVALTAHAMAEIRDDAIAAGMDEFITKPVSRVQLRDLLDRLADQARSVAPRVGTLRSQ